MTAALKLGDADSELAGLLDETNAVDRALTDGLVCLPGFAGSPEELAAHPVPGSESLGEFSDRFNEIDTEERQARTKSFAVE